VVSVLFWNLAENPDILPHVRCLGRNRSVDIFLFAESPDNLGPALKGLNTLRRGTYKETGKARLKVRVISRLGPPEFNHLFTTLGRETAIWSIRAPKLVPPEILLAVTHLPSKAGGHSDAGQAKDAGDVASELAGIEDKRNHRNTVFVGDFNMNPYDPGMTLVTGVHGLMTTRLAQMPDRLYRNRRYRRFYNPMWGFFGDRTPGPAGTHYWRSHQPHNTHWGMLDQVLIRPALINQLATVEILDHDGKHSLLASDGAPNNDHLSDHLPIYFQLDV
jgi:endonuclease/exonuclease/phosphatase family metal-dependent hydrolase